MTLNQAAGNPKQPASLKGSHHRRAERAGRTNCVDRRSVERSRVERKRFVNLVLYVAHPTSDLDCSVWSHVPETQIVNPVCPLPDGVLGQELVAFEVWDPARVAGVVSRVRCPGTIPSRSQTTQPAQGHGLLSGQTDLEIRRVEQRVPGRLDFIVDKDEVIADCSTLNQN